MTAKTLTLPALPVRDMVLFPGARVPFVVGRSGSVRTLDRSVKAGDHLLLLTQRDAREDDPGQSGLYGTGVLAQVESLLELTRDKRKVGVKGIARVRLERYVDEGDFIQAEVTLLTEPAHPGGDAALLPAFRSAAEAFLARTPEAARVLTLDQVRELPLGRAIDTVAALLPTGVREKQGILEQLEIEPRLRALQELLEIDAVRHATDQVLWSQSSGDANGALKAFAEGERIRSTRAEGGKKDEFAQLREQILAAGMSEEAEKKALEEVERLQAMPPQSAETTVSRTFLEWLLALPWKQMADERLDLDEAETVLEVDHAGLDRVKARILEYLAVMRRLRDQGGSAALRGPILCLVGPPGVGKTSLARSIARALHRPFVRFALGGLRDEAEIRGHRRTYIGAMPGRIISLLRKAGVGNPLILLDELDKMASDWRGDPASALLEVLDPEQNHSFQDHYLDLGYDLSKVLFLCTANVRHAIPQPLEDRLEVIELSGYTQKEKLAIAERHLVPKALESHGMTGLGIRFEEGALDRIVQTYTKEAGVRQLEREISAVLRKLARQSLQPLPGETFDPLVTPGRLPRLLGPEKYLESRPEEQALPGVVNGLAWTSTGGDLLTIEAATLPGKGNLKLTGKLGDVMQESAQIALSYVRARAERLGLAADFLEKLDLHVHVPEGAIPKDGPSAGITMATALVSALTGIPARRDLAMTGELTLRGRVLPIGGLKEKLLAAHRLGCRTAVIPAENARHLEEIPDEVREQMSIHLVDHMDEVIGLALVGIQASRPLPPGDSQTGLAAR